MPGKQIRSTKKSGHSIQSLMERAKSFVPPPPKAKKAKYRGKLSKLGWLEAWAKIFENNELLSPDQRLTDDQIKELVLKDFPHKPKIKKSLEKYNVQYWRLLYNKGWMHKMCPPPKISFRYNAQGTAIRIGSGRERPLTITERRDWIRKYSALAVKEHERYQSHRKSKPKESHDAEPPPPE